MRVSPHCTVRILARTAALAAIYLMPGADVAARQAGPAAPPAAGDATFVVFLKGREIGREQGALARSGSGWTITSSGTLGAPFNLVNKRFEVTYAPDWQPIELKIEATLADPRDPKAEPRVLSLSTSFATTTAINEITQNGITSTKTDQITARALILPNNFFAAYEAMAVRLSSMTPGSELAVYIAPQAEIKATVRSVTAATYETPAGALKAQRFSVTFASPGGPLDVEVTVDERRRLAKLEIGSAGLSVARQDLAGVATRQRTYRNPTDIEVRIPAAGFGIAGTLTTPVAQGRLRSPAVVLLAGSAPVERDATVAGIPLFAQLAGQLAARDFVVVRYDKRGAGQSGGRVERVTMQDHADDAVEVVRWLAKRKDVDPRRIYVAGHGEGASVAMLAAAREKKIQGLVLLAGTGTPGRELILEQQQDLLAKTSLSEAERAEKVALQTKIVEAAVTQKGWEGLPAEVRAAADTPWYRSLLTFDPAAAMKQIRQPLLILHGALDAEVRPYHAGRLAELARARKKAASVEVKQLPALNHLFVAAKTGDVTEYASLEPAAVSPEVAAAIASWVGSVPR